MSNLADRVTGHPDADGLLFGEHDLRHQLGPRQDKGIGARQAFFQEPVGGIRDMGVLADMSEIRAHEGEGLIGRPAGNLLDPSDRLGGENIAADTVAGVGGITDDRPVLQFFHDLLNQTELRVVRIDG